ncbi:MAG: EF-Tu/IF-2/RF-3 family GTPase, partial [Sarcina sp.]
LLEDIERELGIKSYPINWPIGSGKDFKGVYERKTNTIQAFDGGNHGQTAVESVSSDVSDPIFNELLGSSLHDKLMEDIELLDYAGDDFNLDKVRAGELTPVFFGSALTNFGVEPFLKEFLDLTSSPLPRNSNIGEIDTFEEPFSAFVFKIQANMNKAHRDRLAFMRICSGKFEKGMEVHHVQGGKKVKLAQPQQFLAQDREMVEEAFAGDIIGVFDPGIFSIGDTLCVNPKKFKFEGIPTFAPEHFARVKPVDTMKRKQFIKGVTQIAQEGAIQVFKELHIGMEEIIVGVVGVLQFEVLEYRLKNEYNVDIKMDRLAYRYVRWIENDDMDVDSLNLTSDTKKVKDFKDRNLLIFQNDWGISWALDHNNGLILSGVGKASE